MKRPASSLGLAMALVCAVAPAAAQRASSAADGTTLSAGAAAVRSRPPSLPAFLRPRARVPRLEVTRIRDGVVRARRDGEPINEPSLRAMLMSHPVLDPDRGGTPPRPRVLCEGEIRVALHVDRDSLATVALDGAVLRPTREVRTGDPARTPGLYLSPGAPLEIVSEEGGLSRVVFDGFFVRAEGYVEPRRIGYAFRPAPPRQRTSWDAELPSGATFLDAPDGQPIAELEPYGNAHQRHVARALGAPRRDHRLIRLEGSNFTLVGWVDASAVVDVESRSGGHGSGSGGGGGGSSPHAVPLPAGTLLLDDTHEVIGRLEAEQRLVCIEACDAETIRVIVPACVGDVRLWARRPG